MASLTMTDIENESVHWKEAIDPKSGRTYFYDRRNRETQWRKPLCLASPTERQDMIDNENKQKSFFEEMEANVLRRDFSECYENNRLSPNEMASEFSRQRAGEAKALVQISRELDRPGALGFFSFVLPLILDGLFHNVMPRIIMPNVIAMLQRTDYDFRGVRRRKRQDR